jgi:hypothetical protein
MFRCGHQKVMVVGASVLNYFGGGGGMLSAHVWFIKVMFCCNVGAFLFFSLVSVDFFLGFSVVSCFCGV